MAYSHFGDVFGHLTVTGLSDVKVQGQRAWECLCSCGNTTTVPGNRLRSGETRSCGHLKGYREGYATDWVHPGSSLVSGTYWATVKRNARARGLDLQITKEQSEELFRTQKGICALSGRKLIIKSSSRSVGDASLDRIDSSLGYVDGNVQWVHKDVNMAKKSLSDSDFIAMCREVVKHADRKEE